MRQYSRKILELNGYLYPDPRLKKQADCLIKTGIKLLIAGFFFILIMDLVIVFFSDDLSALLGLRDFTVVGHLSVSFAGFIIIPGCSVAVALKKKAVKDEQYNIMLADRKEYYLPVALHEVIDNYNLRRNAVVICVFWGALIIYSGFIAAAIAFGLANAALGLGVFIGLFAFETGSMIAASLSAKYMLKKAASIQREIEAEVHYRINGAKILRKLYKNELDIEY